jgi:uncharacterized protein (DUF302 family)
LGLRFTHQNNIQEDELYQRVERQGAASAPTHSVPETKGATVNLSESRERHGTLLRVTSDKTVSGLIENIKMKAPEFGFSVRHVFDMKTEYADHEVEVAPDFDLRQVMVCNMERSYKSMTRNMDRAAVLLQPKHITVYSKDGKTVVSYAPLSQSCIQEVLPEDSGFHDSLHASCMTIVEMIKAAAA